MPKEALNNPPFLSGGDEEALKFLQARHAPAHYHALCAAAEGAAGIHRRLLAFEALEVPVRRAADKLDDLVLPPESLTHAEVRRLGDLGRALDQALAGYDAWTLGAERVQKLRSADPVPSELLKGKEGRRIEANRVLARMVVATAKAIGAEVREQDLAALGLVFLMEIVPGSHVASRSLVERWGQQLKQARKDLETRRGERKHTGQE